MPRVCVLLATGFEEIEAITVVDVLRRADVEVVVLGVSGKSIEGSHGIRVEADALLADRADDEWDAVILPGGLPGAHNLRDDAAVQELLARQHERGGRLAAICAAPIALSSAGVLAEREATSYPGFEDEMRCKAYREDHVVTDGNVTTSRGPGTALEFSLKLVGLLADDATAARLADAMLVGGLPVPWRPSDFPA